MSNVVVKKLDSASDKEEERILIREFTNIFRSGYSLFGEMELCMPSHFENTYPNILNMEVRDDDTFCVSFPKTGTTWSQEMVWLIGNDLNYEGAKVPIMERFPFLEHSSLFDYREIYKKCADFSVPDHASDSVAFIDKMAGPRFIKSHLPFCMLPEDICNNRKHPKIVYITRNPKDCLISYYHHCRLLEGYKGDFDSFYKLFVDGKLCFAPYWPHVLEFWKRRNDKNILFIRYEDMKADLPSVIKKVAAFLDKCYTDEEVAKLAGHLSFDSMKNNRAVNYENVTDANKKSGIIKEEGKFMRSGKVGDFKQYLSEEQVAKIDQWTINAVKGSDFEVFKH